MLLMRSLVYSGWHVRRGACIAPRWRAHPTMAWECAAARPPVPAVDRHDGGECAPHPSHGSAKRPAHPFGHASCPPVTISRRTNDRCPGARDDLAPARRVVVMSLSPREQDILERIESQLRGEDPALAQRLTGAPRQEPARPRPWMLLLAVLSILGGIGLMILAAILANLILMVAGVSFSVIVPTLTIASYLLGRSQYP
jgi:Protein of unknown function (DUF3040)